MHIEGPIITKKVVVPAHEVDVLDLDAYWNLDWAGDVAAEDAEPMNLYAKVAWPTVGDAQRQARQERLAREAAAAAAKKETREMRAAARRERQERAAARRAEHGEGS